MTIVLHKVLAPRASIGGVSLRQIGVRVSEFSNVTHYRLIEIGVLHTEDIFIKVILEYNY